MLEVPIEIGAAIIGFDADEGGWEIHDLQSRIADARQRAGELSEEQQKGAWAELLAFSLVESNEANSPWKSYFAPFGSGQTPDGTVVYFPDIADADAAIVEHWEIRVHFVSDPRLLARYSDLVWELSKPIANTKPNVEFARAAIDNYILAADNSSRDDIHRFRDLKRALTLAIRINDVDRRDKARESLLNLHDKAFAERGMWWVAFDILVDQSKAGWKAEETKKLLEDMRTVFDEVRDQSNTGFNQFETQNAGDRLIDFFNSISDKQQAKLTQTQIAEAFVAASHKTTGMRAASQLQTAITYFNDAGNKAEAAKVLPLLEAANLASIEEMRPVSVEHSVPIEDVDAFVNGIVVEALDLSLRRIAINFLSKKEEHEKQLKELVESSPLAAFIPKSMIRGDMVVAVVGSFDVDPTGRLIDHVHQVQTMSTFWLRMTFEKLFEKFEPTADDILNYCNAAEVFGDGAILREGLDAWIAGDYVKAAHIIPFQAENGLRNIAKYLGIPTKKPNSNMSGAWLALTFGELLHSSQLIDKLGSWGPSIALHLLTLYVDVRGQNLRNEIGHGLIGHERMSVAVVDQLVHSVLLLGSILSKTVEQRSDLPLQN